MIGSEVKASFTANTPEELERKQANIEQLMNVSLAYFNLGRLYVQDDKLDKALENYEKGLKIKKDDPYAHKLRSEVRIKKGGLQGAIDDLSVVVKSPMRSPGFHFDNGLLLILHGKDAEAEKEFALYLKKVFRELENFWTNESTKRKNSDQNSRRNETRDEARCRYYNGGVKFRAFRFDVIR